MATLTKNQLAALRAFAAKHGRHWKAKLLSDWLNGRSKGELQAICNAFGPSWLLTFRLPQEEEETA